MGHVPLKRCFSHGGRRANAEIPFEEALCVAGSVLQMMKVSHLLRSPWNSQSNPMTIRTQMLYNVELPQAELINMICVKQVLLKDLMASLEVHRIGPKHVDRHMCFCCFVSGMHD